MTVTVADACATAVLQRTMVPADAVAARRPADRAAHGQGRPPPAVARRVAPHPDRPQRRRPWSFAVVQTYGVVVAAAVVDTWWAWLAAFVWMGRGHALLNILGHEAAHRLLFPNRLANDGVGRWILGYPTLLPFYAYRRAHFAHHRDELGPDEPDTELYRGYPIPNGLVAAQAAPRPHRRERRQEHQARRADRRPQARAGGSADPRRAGSCSPASPSPPSVRSPTSCGSARGARCGSCPTGCGRSPSTAGWSAPPIAAARPT